MIWIKLYFHIIPPTYLNIVPAVKVTVKVLRQQSEGYEVRKPVSKVFKKKNHIHFCKLEHGGWILFNSIQMKRFVRKDTHTNLHLNLI